MRMREEKKMNNSILLSKKETAQLLSLCVRSVENLITAKKLVARKIGSRTLITRASVEKLARGDVENPTRLAAEARRDHALPSVSGAGQ
jgi:predicted XRE-type DNA-binding protein